MVIANLIAEEADQVRLVFLIALTGLPFMLLGFVKILARYKVIFVDLFGSAYLLGAFLAYVTISQIGWFEIGK